MESGYISSMILFNFMVTVYHYQRFILSPIGIEFLEYLFLSQCDSAEDNADQTCEQ